MVVQIVFWVKKRLSCTVRGHVFTHDRVYDPMAKGLIPGYRCNRCGKTQRFLYRWQVTVDED